MKITGWLVQETIGMAGRSMIPKLLSPYSTWLAGIDVSSPDMGIHVYRLAQKTAALMPWIANCTMEYLMENYTLEL